MLMESSETAVFKPERATVKVVPLWVRVVTVVPVIEEVAVTVRSSAPPDVVPVVNGTFEVRTKVALETKVFGANPTTIWGRASVVPSTATYPVPPVAVKVDNVATCAFATPANTRPTAANVKNVLRKSSISWFFSL
jgi:hypothetical protein